MPSAPFRKRTKAELQKKVKWVWSPFTSSARPDGLVLHHWERLAGPGGTKPSANAPASAGGDYPFAAKFNKKVALLRYSDEEYASVLADDSGWSRQETDYLLELCGRFDLRFAVIHDRYEYATRTMEELKARYYGVGSRLLAARAVHPAATAHHPLMKEPFHAAHEAERKAALAILLSRPATQERDDAEVLAEAAKVDERRRANAGALTAAGLLAPPGGGGGGGANRLRGAVARAHTQRQNAGVARSVEGPEGDAGMAGIAGGAGSGGWPGPGAYARGQFCDGKMKEVVGGGAKGAEMINQVLEEIGAKPPSVPTAAAAAAWKGLLVECVATLVARKKTARLQAGGRPGGPPTEGFGADTAPGAVVAFANGPPSVYPPGYGPSGAVQGGGGPNGGGGAAVGGSGAVGGDTPHPVLPQHQTPQPPSAAGAAHAATAGPTPGGEAVDPSLAGSSGQGVMGEEATEGGMAQGKRSAVKRKPPARFDEAGGGPSPRADKRKKR